MRFFVIVLQIVKTSPFFARQYYLFHPVARYILKQCFLKQTCSIRVPYESDHCNRLAKSLHAIMCYIMCSG